MHAQKHNFGASKLKLAANNNTNIAGNTDCMTNANFTLCVALTCAYAQVEHVIVGTLSDIYRNKH